MGGSVVAFIATSWPSSISATKLGRPQVGLVPAPPYNGPPRPPTMNGLPRAAAGEEVAGGGWGEAADELYIYNILLVSTSPQWKYKGKLAGLCSPHGRSRFSPAATPSPGLRIFREVGLAWF